tara:strand:+ start:11215 stop:12204 length:990 start_codon:yes stop_codon:yes gene_type:complete
MNKLSPFISVLLPVRNGEQYLRDAINSVLKQSFLNFELIVINDGSTDSTLGILESYNDKRIIILNTKGIGLVKALNMGLEQCSGNYVARMDADDICMPDRFEEQIAVFESDNLIGVICSDVILIDENNNEVGFSKDASIYNFEYLENGLTYKQAMKPIIHPTVMLKTALLKEVGGYRDYLACEDRDLWLRLICRTKFYRIKQPLLKYRLNHEGVSSRLQNKQTVSGMLCVLNYNFLKSNKVDLYNYDLNLHDHFRKYISTSVDPIISNAEVLSKFKKKIRGKNKVVKLVVLLLPKYSIPIINHVFFNRRKKIAIIKKATNILEAFLKLN